MTREKAELYIALAVALTLCSFVLLMTLAVVIGLFTPTVDNKELFPIIKQALPYVTGGLLVLLGQYMQRRTTTPPEPPHD